MTLFQKALAEGLGTCAIIFIGGLSMFLSEKYPNLIPPLCVPISWGLMVGLMILAAGKISGAHFNPAVTLAFALAKRIPAAQVPLYWGSQCLGGLVAIRLLMALQKRCGRGF